MSLKIIIRLMILVVVGVIVIPATLLIAAFAFFEPQDVTADTWSYTLGIPGLAKEIPVYSECEPAKYSHNARDGERIGAVMIEYSSWFSVDDVSAGYKQYFQEKSCNLDGFQDFFCDGKDYSITIEQKDECTFVDILVLGDF